MPTVLDEFGNPLDVSVDEAAALLSRPGFSLESPEAAAARAEKAQYDTLGEAVIHGAESAVSEASLGLSDAALAGILGDEYREDRARRERLFPVVGATARVGGAIVPLLLSGGASAPASAARLAARVGSGAARFVGAPVRGAAALGRAAEAGIGAGLRGLGVTGKGIAGRAFLRGTQFAGSGALEGALYGAGHELSEAALAPGGNYDHLAERVWAGAKGSALFGALTGGALGGIVGGTSAVASRFAGYLKKGGTESLAGEIAESSAVRALDPGKRAAKELEKTGRTREVGRELIDRDIVRAFRSDEAMLARAEAVRRESGEEIGALLQAVDDTGARVDPKIFQKIDELVERRRAVKLGSHQRAAKALDAEVAPLRELAESGGLTHTKLHETRANIDTKINWAADPKSPRADDLRDLRRLLEGALQESAERSLPGQFQGAYKRAKRGYGAATWAEKQLADNLAGGKSNRFLGLSENIWGAGGLMAGALTGSLGLTALAGIGTTLGHKVVRSYGHGVVATLAQKLLSAEKRVDQSARRIMRRASDVRRAGTAETAEAIEADRTERALKRRPTETREAAYARHVEELQRFQRDPLAALEKDFGPAAAKAPQFAMAYGALRQRMAADLLAHAPGVATTGEVIFESKQPINADPVSIARWARRKQVWDDPTSVLDEIERGTLTVDHVEVLKQFPHFFEDVRGKVGDELIEMESRGQRPEFPTRVQLGMLLGIPTDRALMPTQLASTAALYEMRAQQAAAGPPPRRQASAGPSPRAEGLDTKLDRIEMGDAPS